MQYIYIYIILYIIYYIYINLELKIKDNRSQKDNATEGSLSVVSNWTGPQRTNKIFVTLSSY